MQVGALSAVIINLTSHSKAANYAQCPAAVAIR